jgi:hypothetical protein
MIVLPSLRYIGISRLVKHSVPYQDHKKRKRGGASVFFAKVTGGCGRLPDGWRPADGVSAGSGDPRRARDSGAGFKQIAEVKFLKENYFVRFKKVEAAKDP